MKKICLALFITTVLVGCGKSGSPAQPKAAENPVEAEWEEIDPPEIPVDELSLECLVGKWLLLDSEGEVDPSGDYLSIEKQDTSYQGVLVYQDFAAKCTLRTDGTGYFVIAEGGTEYKIGRTESTRGKAHNGIWLALGDIDLGNFQREDMLTKLR